jgi:flagellar motility protein MotE (MotC chaperone)
MIRYFRELRFLPIAVVASACLLVLTAADLLLGRNTSSQAEFVDATVVHTKNALSPPPDAERSWAQQMFNFPDPKGSVPDRPRPALLPAVPPLIDKNADLITGSVTAGEKSEKPKGETPAASKDPKEPPPSPDGRVIPNAGAPGPSTSERAILERLQERRLELEKRARELDIREGLIAAAEKRVDSKLTQIKDGEAQLATAAQKKDETEAARFKGLVTMYETMKPRDAAKIFDRLEVGVLIEMASLINPRSMSDILAQMSAERAEQLTVELASRSQSSPKAGAGAVCRRSRAVPRSESAGILNQSVQSPYPPPVVQLTTVSSVRSWTTQPTDFCCAGAGTCTRWTRSTSSHRVTPLNASLWGGNHGYAAPG